MDSLDRMWLCIFVLYRYCVGLFTLLLYKLVVYNIIYSIIPFTYVIYFGQFIVSHIVDNEYHF